MPEKEYFEWRFFFPLTSDDKNSEAEKDTVIAPFTLITKLNMLSMINEKHSRHSSNVDIYYPLDNTDVCLKIQNNTKIEIEIRNRHKEQSSSGIQHWSIYELKSPRIDLPDKIVSRLDQITREKISQILSNEDRSNLSFIKIEKHLTIWQMDDSDRQIEESDISISLSNEQNNICYIPKYWRTIAIQTSDYDKLLKSLTTLQIEDDKDLQDYFSYLLSQTRFHQQDLFPTLPSEKAYMNLLTLSYAAFVELLQRIHINQT